MPLTKISPNFRASTAEEPEPEPEPAPEPEPEPDAPTDAGSDEPEE